MDNLGPNIITVYIRNFIVEKKPTVDEIQRQR